MAPRNCPFHERLEHGQRYAWCACGKSATQPFCDGSHKGTGIEPVVFTRNKPTGGASLCACKKTATPPYCDGAHRALMLADLDGSKEDRFPEGKGARDEHTARVAIKPAVPDLPVKDAPAAIRYYADVLGFDKEFDDAIVGFDHTMFAGMARGDLRVTLDEHRANECDQSVQISCEVDDVDALHDELVARGANVTMPLQNRIWGARDFSITDLNGHSISFSMPLKDESD